MAYAGTDSMKVLDLDELERDYGVMDFSDLTPEQTWEATDILTEIWEKGTLTSQTRKQVLKERLSSLYGEVRKERS